MCFPRDARAKEETRRLASPSTRKARKAKVNAENAGTPRGYACEFLVDETKRTTLSAGLCIFARLCSFLFAPLGAARFAVTHALYLDARRRVLTLERAHARELRKNMSYFSLHPRTTRRFGRNVWSIVKALRNDAEDFVSIATLSLRWIKCGKYMNTCLHYENNSKLLLHNILSR